MADEYTPTLDEVRDAALAAHDIAVLKDFYRYREPGEPMPPYAGDAELADLVHAEMERVRQEVRETVARDLESAANGSEAWGADADRRLAQTLRTAARIARGESR